MMDPLSRLINKEISKEEYIYLVSDMVIDNSMANTDDLLEQSEILIRYLKRLTEDFKGKNKPDKSHEVNLSCDFFIEAEKIYAMINSYAKRLLIEADIFEFRDTKKFLKIRDNAFRIYEIKDLVTAFVIDNVKSERITAYPIFLKSKELSSEIIEILIKGERMIMHTKSMEIKKRMLEIGRLFYARKSVIDDYVNTKI